MEPLNDDETDVLNDDTNDIVSDEYSVEVDPNELSEENNKNILVEYLSNEGFRARVDEVGDIVLKLEGYELYILVTWDYITCGLNCTYWQELFHRQECLEAISEVNLERKLVSLGMREYGSTTIRIDYFVSRVADLTENLTMKLEWLVSAKRLLDSKITEKIEAKNKLSEQSENASFDEESPDSFDWESGDDNEDLSNPESDES